MEKACWFYASGDTACCTIIIVYALLYSSTADITLSNCGSDNTVELLETRTNNTVTCSGIPDDYNVDWQVTVSSRPTVTTIGTCSAGSTTCTDFSRIGYLATRPSADTSVMAISLSGRLDFVLNGTLDCVASKSGIPQMKSCQLDIVSAPSNVTCTVQLNTSSSSVVGRCDVTKVYSNMGRYICQWYGKQGSTAEFKVNESVAIQTTSTTDVTPTGGNYTNTVCSVIIPRPLGDTFYRVVIFPGGISRDAGNITKPKEKPDFCDEQKCLFFLILLLLLFLVPLGCLIYRFNSKWNRNRGSLSGTETTLGTTRNNVSPESGPVNNGNKHSSQKEETKHTGTGGRNNVSAASGAVNNGNQQTSQEEKNKHTGTDGSPRKPRHPDAPVELTAVRTSSPPQEATVHGDNQAFGTPHRDHQASGTPRLRPLPEPSRMTSVERNSTAETSNINGLDKQPKLPPIGKPDNRP